VRRVLAAALAILALLGAACAPDPRPAAAGGLLDELDGARARLAADPAQGEAACGTAESVVTRLEGVSGLTNDDLRPTYLALRDAGDALTAACGQLRLLELPADEGQAAVRQAHARWRAGAERDLALVCGYLTEAARSLGRTPPTC
jgi:hypothetical protein